VSQPLGALHQYRAPSLRSSLPWNNNINNSQRIMISSVKWSREQPASSSSSSSSSFAAILV
jgi:hypothetical protein